MKFRQFKDENGMSLVELLAALSLFAVVIALSSTVIIQMVSGESNAIDDISLNQETNLLINEMRSDYQNKLKNMNDNETFNICFQNKTIEINELVIDNEPIKIEDGCTTKQFGQEDNMHVKLTTQISQEKFELETTFSANTQLPITLEIEKSKEEETGSIDKCHYTNHTIFHDGLEIQNASRKPCDEYTFASGVDFLGNLYIHNHTLITVSGNVYIKNDLTIKPNTKFTVYGDLVVDGKLDIKGELCVKGKFEDKESYSCNTDI